MPAEQGKPALLDQPKSDTRTPPPYKVILHNDDISEMNYVAHTIFRLTPLSIEESYRKMMEADRNGLALLLVCHRERAELYQEQFQSCGLTVTIEPQ